jgi:hypothetical protein
MVISLDNWQHVQQLDYEQFPSNARSSMGMYTL